MSSKKKTKYRGGTPRKRHKTPFDSGEPPNCYSQDSCIQLDLLRGTVTDGWNGEK